MHQPHQSIMPHTVTPPLLHPPAPGCHSSPSTDRKAQVSRCLPGFTWRLRPQHWGGSPGGGCHVLSFKMTVARMRKKVFQPRVTAKPRHTIIRDRPQPVGQIQVYIQQIQEDTAGPVTSCFLSLSFLKPKCSRGQKCWSFRTAALNVAHTSRSYHLYWSVYMHIQALVNICMSKTSIHHYNMMWIAKRMRKSFSLSPK